MFYWRLFLSRVLLLPFIGFLRQRVISLGLQVLFQIAGNTVRAACSTHADRYNTTNIQSRGHHLSQGVQRIIIHNFSSALYIPICQGKKVSFITKEETQGVE